MRFARPLVFASFGLCIALMPALASASLPPSASLSPASCNALYNLPVGTITTPASSVYLNPQTCSAYAFLISRYSPGPCSHVGFSDAKVQGITSLNSDFAQRLAKMLQAASAAGYNITINSAFRTLQGEHCANATGFGGNASLSMHTKGLAADLIFPNDPNSKGGCDVGEDSAAYKWVQQHDRAFGIGSYDQLHAHAGGECNHVEAATPVAGGAGPGLGGVGTPLSPFTSAFSGMVQQPTIVPPPPPPPPAPVPVQTTPTQTTPVTPPTLGTLNSTPYTAGTCAAQTYCYSGNLYSRSAQCIDTELQACQYGCTNNACAPAPQKPAASTADTSKAANASQGSQQTNTPAATVSGSANDYLLQFLKSTSAPAASTSVATTTHISLNYDVTNASNTTSLAPTTIASGTETVLAIIGRSIMRPAAATSASTAIRQIVSASIFASATSGPNNTFTSADLTGTTSEAASRQSLWARMQTILRNMLAYLQPFGGFQQQSGE